MTYVRIVAPPAEMEWRQFTCSTDAGEPDACDYSYLAPIRVGAHYDAGGPLDFCPTCGEYLPFTTGATDAIVAVETKHPEWAQATLEARS